jgi:coenzyme F420-0:L-glutamate ligase/coenzyme F420-1:gamma-L-glutamate ligase
VDALAAIRTRRSLRQLAARGVPREIIDQLVALACLAPAPHHTRPWRYVIVGHERRAALARAMGAAWRADLDAMAIPKKLIAKLRGSRSAASPPPRADPRLTREGLRDWPDSVAPATMGHGSKPSGAAMQNIMLGVTPSPRVVLISTRLRPDAVRA